MLRLLLEIFIYLSDFLNYYNNLSINTYLISLISIFSISYISSCIISSAF